MAQVTAKQSQGKAGARDALVVIPTGELADLLRHELTVCVRAELPANDPADDAETRSFKEALRAGVMLTKSQVARYLQISIPTLTRLMKTNAIPFHRVGDSPRFDPVEIREAMRGGK